MKAIAFDRFCAERSCAVRGVVVNVDAERCIACGHYLKFMNREANRIVDTFEKLGGFSFDEDLP